eukprot:scaffold7166_cov140-Isochrysis_galbana.AAC.4
MAAPQSSGGRPLLSVADEPNGSVPRYTPLPVAYYNEDVANKLLRSSGRAWDDLRALSITPAVLDCEYIDYMLLGRKAA